MVACASAAAPCKLIPQEVEIPPHHHHKATRKGEHLLLDNYLFEREKASFILLFTPQRPQQPMLGQDKEGARNFIWVSHVIAAAADLGHCLLLSQKHYQETGLLSLKWSSQDLWNFTGQVYVKFWKCKRWLKPLCHNTDSLGGNFKMKYILGL